MTTQLAKIDTTPGSASLERFSEENSKWARARLDLIKKQVCPVGTTDLEFELFVEQCKRADLDPLRGEAFCVPRTSSVNVNGRWEYVTKNVFTPAESGMEGRADRFPDFRGLRAAAVYEGDEVAFDESAGEVVHKTNPVTRGKLLGAWGQAKREGRILPIEWCGLAEYQQRNKDGRLTGQWSSKPATMIVKCARAAALRRAYPNVFGNSAVAEELESKDLEQAAQASPDAQVALEPQAPKAKKAKKEEAAPSPALEVKAAEAKVEERPVASPPAKPAAPQPTIDSGAKALPEAVTRETLEEPLVRASVEVQAASRTLPAAECKVGDVVEGGVVSAVAKTESGATLRVVDEQPPKVEEPPAQPVTTTAASEPVLQPPHAVEDAAAPALVDELRDELASAGSDVRLLTEWITKVKRLSADKRLTEEETKSLRQTYKAHAGRIAGGGQ